MKNWRFLLILSGWLLAQSCDTNTAEITQNENTDNLEELPNMDDVFAANQWDEFRYGIVNNNPDFDLLKHFDPEQVSPETAFQLTDDEYTKMTLGITPYELLEDAIFDGISAKAFYVLIAADDIMMGTIYYFRETSYGLELLGTMPY